jgi:hypothetical protein
MNKQVKKKLEHQLQTAIEGILIKQDAKAAGKSKKIIRQASKAVVKKFNKASKSIEGKNKAEKKKKVKTKRKVQSGRSQLKNITGETARVRRTYAKEPKAPVAQVPAAVATSEGGSVTEN